MGDELVGGKASMSSCRVWRAKEDIGSSFTVRNIFKNTGADVGHHIVIDVGVVN